MLAQSQNNLAQFDKNVEIKKIEHLCHDFCQIQDCIIESIRYYADIGDLTTAAYILMVFYKDTLCVVPELTFNLEWIFE